ncbi:MAG: HD domain-containing phosphohydrolase, partial [Wenzhouxiangella sp.]
MKLISWDEFVKQEQGEYELTIDSGDLKLGDFVVRIEPIDPGQGFAPSGQPVDTFEQKQWFWGHCRRVTIDLHRCLNRRQRLNQASDRPAAPTGAARPAVPASIDGLRKSRLTPRGIVDAWRVYRELSLCAQSLILSFHRHGQVDIDGAERAVERLIETLPRHLASLVWLTHIKEKSRYAYQHGLNVAILGAAFAHAMKWDRSVVKAAALAGLLHDLGKTRLNLAILNKTGVLTPAEFDHIKLHARLGHGLLAQNERVPAAVLQAVLQHHERVDGNGYPDRLGIDRISLLARVVGMIDAYDAITSARVHCPARSHQQALGILWKERDGQFDKVLVEAYSEFLGWAPPGTLLRLNNGDLAVALHSSNGKSQPLVRKLRAVGEGVQFGLEFDLAALQGERANSGESDPLAEILPDGTSGINLRELTRQLPKVLIKSGADPGPRVTPTTHRRRPGILSGLVGRRERRRKVRVDAPRGMQVLVVDDSATVRSILKAMLVQTGYRVNVAATAEEGLRSARSDPPDLIF